MRKKKLKIHISMNYFCINNSLKKCDQKVFSDNCQNIKAFVVIDKLSYMHLNAFTRILYVIFFFMFLQVDLILL